MAGATRPGVPAGWYGSRRAALGAYRRASRAAGAGLWQRIHGYVYGRWTYGYIGAAIGELRRRAWQRLLYAPFLVQALSPQRWAAGYHGKVIPTEQARRLVQVHEPVAAALPEQVLPFPTARDLVLDHPDHIVVLDCPCRLAREHPCLPLDVCLVVGDPFASFVLTHHPERARAISPEEAVAILEAEAARGHVHHAFFKEAMAGRFFAICNCCSCCCGAISAHRHGTPMLVSSGYVAAVDTSRCVGCGACAAACAFGALGVDEGHAVVDAATCMGCGVCVGRCPQGAIALRRDPAKGEPLEIQKLLSAAAEAADTTCVAASA